MKFTAVTLLRWFEDLAKKHNKGKMYDRAWGYVQVLMDQEITTGKVPEFKELLEIKESWWYLVGQEESPVKHMCGLYELRSVAIGTEEVRTPFKANRFAHPQGMSTPSNSSMSGVSADSVPYPRAW